jgi:hypothetical protein
MNDELDYSVCRVWVVWIMFRRGGFVYLQQNPEGDEVFDPKR